MTPVCSMEVHISLGLRPLLPRPGDLALPGSSRRGGDSRPFLRRKHRLMMIREAPLRLGPDITGEDKCIKLWSGKTLFPLDKFRV